MKLCALLLPFAVALMGAGTSTPPDRATWLIGTWTCESGAGSVGTKVYKQQSDGTIAARNEYRVPGDRWFQDTETYAYSPASGIWRMTTPGNWLWPSFSGTASRWDGTKWEFNGRNQRLVFTQLSEKAYRSDWKRLDRGYWVVTSTTVCDRF